MIVFDVPNPSIIETPFESRFKLLFPRIPSDHPLAVSTNFTSICYIDNGKVIPSRQKCTSREHVAAALRSLIKEGSEGVILQALDSCYDYGRSSNLLKLKATRGDREALVVDILADTLVLRL